MKYVILDNDHRDILKCFSGKKFKYHCWCDDHHDWQEMDYFNATRIQRVRIDVRQEPNWWRVGEKGILVLYKGNSFKVRGVTEDGIYTKLTILNELIDITLTALASECIIDFENEGLKLHEDDLEIVGQGTR